MFRFSKFKMLSVDLIIMCNERVNLIDCALSESVQEVRSFSSPFFHFFKHSHSLKLIRRAKKNSYPE